MSILDRITSLASDATDQVTARVESFRDDRSRRSLLVELGELIYRRHRGEEVADATIDAVLAQLDDAATGPDDTSDGAASEES